MTADRRRARRAWIAEHHPDRGGDPRRFAEGLLAFDRVADAAAADVDVDVGVPRPTVVGSRRPDRVVRRVVRRVTRARRRRTHHILP